MLKNIKISNLGVNIKIRRQIKIEVLVESFLISDLSMTDMMWCWKQRFNAYAQFNSVFSETRDREAKCSFNTIFLSLIQKGEIEVWYFWGKSQRRIYERGTVWFH